MKGTWATSPYNDYTKAKLRPTEANKEIPLPVTAAAALRATLKDIGRKQVFAGGS